MREQKRVLVAHSYIKIASDSRSHRHHMTQWKHRLMTHLIRVQGKKKPNQ